MPLWQLYTDISLLSFIAQKKILPIIFEGCSFLDTAILHLFNSLHMSEILIVLKLFMFLLIPNLVLKLFNLLLEGPEHL